MVIRHSIEELLAKNSVTLLMKYIVVLNYLFTDIFTYYSALVQINRKII